MSPRERSARVREAAAARRHRARLASRRLCVSRCAVSVPMPGRPSASATAATTGTARSAETVSTPSTPMPARDLDDGVDVREVDDLARRRRPRGPGASPLRSTARRAARGRAPARSRGADGVPRRRRGRSSRAAMVTTSVRRTQLVTPPGGRSHGEMRCQRAIWQPFVRVNVARTRCPSRCRPRAPAAGRRRSRCTQRSSGPARRASMPPASSRVQARVGRGNEPRGRIAAQRPRLAVERLRRVRPRYVIRSDVPDERCGRGADEHTSAASTSATSDARIRPGYCPLPPGYCPARARGTLRGGSVSSQPAMLAAAILLPLGARVTATWHDDSLWANSLRSLGGLAVPYDFASSCGCGRRSRRATTVRRPRLGGRAAHARTRTRRSSRSS